MTLVGFVLASDPVESASPARESIELSIVVLEDFAEGMVVAAKAVDVVRKVIVKLDDILQATGMNTSSTGNEIGRNLEASTEPGSLRPGAHVNYTPLSMDVEVEFADPADLSVQDILSMASNVDQYAEPHMLWPGIYI
ncbi:hypothetical protein BDP55DRAFT_761698 [Colletotrichum godetiae]|uniref:Uncharacterized protein n=1 Tax=Colletotrichum godetiae TaxID=1209918 RepID=A0AAJ0A6H5_9PEZI|nr:uncharacterized protein BDP55DRAFT_761698 [Colletotrichum godetiae]KAK1657411.1 hypothetical protein BDP55DRAFT_761698 [Colletotrichum godetiae]